MSTTTTTTTTTVTANNATKTTTPTQQKPSNIQLFKQHLPPVQSTPLKCCVLGNVDVGKSTLISSLITGKNDNGRGLLRAIVATHQHEIVSGRTSQAAHHICGYNQDGEHVAFNPFNKTNQTIGSTTTSNNTNTTTTNTNNNNNNTPTTLDGIKFNKAKAWHHIVSNSTRVVSLVDLAGHQRYLRTSIAHLVANLPDLAIVLVSPNTGLSKMFVEHMSLCIALRLRIVILVTKIDRADLSILKPLRVDLNNFITQQCQRTPITIKGVTELDQVLGGIGTIPPENYVPIFYISSTTLQHFDLLHAYLSRVLPVTWNSGQNNKDSVVTIDSIDEEDNLHHKNLVNIVDDVTRNSNNQKNVNNNNNINNRDGEEDNDVIVTGNKNHNQKKQLYHLDAKTDMDEPNTLSLKARSMTTTLSDTLPPSSLTQMNSNENDNIQSQTISTTLSSTSLNNTMSNHTTTTTTTGQPGQQHQEITKTMVSRDVTVPHYLEPFVSGEMRVEERFYKSNVGLIVSGIVTYGSFQPNASNSNQFVLLGPFCSNQTTTTNMNPTTVEAVHHAMKKTIKTNAAATATTTGTNTTVANKKNTKDTNVVVKEDTMLDVEFIPVTVKSIQQYRSNIDIARIGEGIGICIKYDEKVHKMMQKTFKYRSKYNHLKDLGRDDVYRGMVLLGLNCDGSTKTDMLPINKQHALADLIASMNPTTTTNKKKGTNTIVKNDVSTLPTTMTLKKYQVPYQLLLSSSIDIDINVLHPASCFRQGYQIVLHCSSLVLPIIVEKVLCVLDKTNNNAQTRNNPGTDIIEMTDINDDNDTRENPFLRSLVETAKNKSHTPPINNDISLRHNQRGILRCRFLHIPYVYIHENEQILLRDGSTRAIGFVSSTYFK